MRERILADIHEKLGFGTAADGSEDLDGAEDDASNGSGDARAAALGADRLG